MAKYLPIDILVDIFSRLPSRSVIRFRCACKSWETLLGGPSFIKAHLDHSAFHGFDMFNYSPRNVSRLAKFNPHNLQFSRMDLPFERSATEVVELVGSCNGIICLYTFRRGSKWVKDFKICLWNPSVTEYTILPEPLFDVSHLYYSDIGYPIEFGVGYVNEDNLDNLKVLVLVRRRHSGYQAHEVFSLRESSWKQLGNALPASCLYCRLGSQVFAEGFICWCPSDQPTNRPSLLLFDVAREEFREHELPDTLSTAVKHIALQNGCISIIARIPSPQRNMYEVWRMTEFGVDDSWMKLYSVDLSGASTWSAFLRFGHWPLGITGSGDILFVLSTYHSRRIPPIMSMELYDCVEKGFKCFNIEGVSFRATTLENSGITSWETERGYGVFCRTKLVNYVESLISPRTIGKRCV